REPSSMHDAPSDPTRRDFLHTTGALLAAGLAESAPAEADSAPKPLAVPDWVREVTRMTFGTPGDVEKAAKAGAQVLHTNVVWPYFPLRRDGGGLSEVDAGRLRNLVAACRKHNLRLVLGLPPF